MLGILLFVLLLIYLIRETIPGAKLPWWAKTSTESHAFVGSPSKVALKKSEGYGGGAMKKDQESDSVSQSSKAEEPGHAALMGAILSVVVSAILLVFWGIELRDTTDPITLHIVTEHFPAVIGLPMAGIASFIVVVLLKHVHGPIEFEGLGFRFSGASGPVAMWIACFLAIVMSIKLLW